MGLKKEKKQEDLEKEKNQNAENVSPADAGSKEAEAAAETATRMVLLPAEDVEKLKAEASVNLENWKRERADFVNYKKIIERDEKTLRSNVKIDVIRKYLPVMDDLELALKVLPEDSKEKAWFCGIELIYKKLQNILDSEGVVKISADEFDPTRHEAITFEPCPEHKSGEIIEVVKQGYMLGDRVLRPAQVRVAQ